MKLERLKESQMDELMAWAGELDAILTPDKLCPTEIKKYPAAMEASERLKRICKWKRDEIKNYLARIEDAIMESIECAEIVLAYKGGIPLMKKKFNSADKRNRELRSRLADHEEYVKLDAEQHQWDIMFSDWVSHVKRLEREYELLQINYSANGGEGSNL